MTEETSMSMMVRRGPGRPRKTESENMEINVVAAESAKEEPKPETPKLYSFKLEKGTNFTAPDFKVVPVDEEGIWQEPREPVLGEDYGPHTKVWPGTIVMVAAEKAKHFDKHKIAKAINNYD